PRRHRRGAEDRTAAARFHRRAGPRRLRRNRCHHAIHGAAGHRSDRHRHLRAGLSGTRNPGRRIMRRFTFAARLGPPADPPLTPLPPDSPVVDIEFVDTYRRLNFGLGSALSVLQACGYTTPEKAVDLAIVSALINAADTRVSRAINAQNGWTREIDIVAPV